MKQIKNELIEASEKTKEISEIIKNESLTLYKTKKEIIKYNKLISDTFVN